MTSLPGPTLATTNIFDSDSTFRLLVESLSDAAIVMIDSAGCLQSWNRGAEQLYRYRSDEIIGKPFSLLLAEGQAELFKSVFDNATKPSQKIEGEDWRIRKDGSRFWAGYTLTPMIDNEGKHLGYSEVSRDLSEQRQFEIRYRLMVESVKDYGIFMLDKNGFVRSWNLGAQLIKGYAPDEIIGKHFSTFYTAPDIERRHPEDELRQAVANGRFEEEGWRVRKDGSEFWANVVITALYDDNKKLVGFSKVTRDLTARMQSETQLRESEEKFRSMIANVKDYAIIMLDPHGRIASWNAGAERIKGWSEGEVLGSSFERFYPPEDVAGGKTKMELECATRDGRFEDFGWRVRKDGTYFWANVVITALRDDKDELRGFSKVTRDITERKEAEEALQKAYEELESFSYSVSHDLRAPLRSMDGFSEILLATLGDKVDERSKGYLNRIRESSKRMARLIDDLLNLSRLSREPLNIKRVDLSEMASKVLAELKRTNPERVVTSVIQPGLTAMADPGLLMVVVENLIGNAWKYSSKKSEALIEVFASTNATGEAKFTVRDNGAGFNNAYRDKLFGAFQRLHGANEFPGTGIGLASVKRVIHRHGGEVDAESQLGEGASFSFTLGRRTDEKND